LRSRVTAANFDFDTSVAGQQLMARLDRLQSGMTFDQVMAEIPTVVAEDGDD
jgi:hypothetical protein